MSRNTNFLMRGGWQLVDAVMAHLGPVPVAMAVR